MTNLLGLLVCVALILASANFDLIINLLNPKAQSKNLQKPSQTYIIKPLEKQSETKPKASNPSKIYQNTYLNRNVQTTNQPTKQLRTSTNTQVETLEQIPTKVKVPERPIEIKPQTSYPNKINQSIQQNTPSQKMNQPTPQPQISENAQVETLEQIPKKVKLPEKPSETKPQASYLNKTSQSIQQNTPLDTINKPTAQVQISENAQVETEQISKKTQPLTQQQDPAEQGCQHYFGYLAQKDRPKETPDRCLTCKNLIDCLLKREQTQ
jgi:hypothetical protein